MPTNQWTRWKAAAMGLILLVNGRLSWSDEVDDGTTSRQRRTTCFRGATMRYTRAMSYSIILLVSAYVKVT